MPARKLRFHRAVVVVAVDSLLSGHRFIVTDPPGPADAARRTVVVCPLDRCARTPLRSAHGGGTLASRATDPHERNQRGRRGGATGDFRTDGRHAAVPEFGHAVIKPLGSPAGTISTFIEVPFKLNEQTCYPDGLVETTRGSKQWTALVEVKTGASELERPQIETYLDVAREIDVDAPREGRAPTRVNWLARQLREAPDGLRIDAFTANARTSTSELLKDVRENPALLIDDPKKDFRMFRVAASSSLGTKRGTGRGGFIDSVLASVDGFHEAVAQQIAPWTARAPQLPKGGRAAVEEAGLDLESPPLDSLEDDEPPDLVEPPEEQTAGAVVEGVKQVSGEASPSVPPAPVDATQDAEMVSWDSAQDRLDHERRSDVPAFPSADE